METFKRQQYVDFLIQEYGCEAHLTPWGIYIDMPNFEDTGRSVVKWRVTEKDIASLNGTRMPRGFVGGAPYSQWQLEVALSVFTGTRGTIHGTRLRVEDDD